MAVTRFRIESKTDHEHHIECDEYKRVHEDWTRSEVVCTLSTLDGQGDPLPTEEKRVVYARGEPHTIASSMQAILSNHQLMSGTDCFICSLTQTQSRFTDKALRWDLHSFHQRFRRAGEVRSLTRSCSDHGDHDETHHVFLETGSIQINHHLNRPAFRVSYTTIEAGQRRNIATLLLTSGDGPEEGEKLFDDAFPSDFLSTCLLERLKKMPIVFYPPPSKHTTDAQQTVWRGMNWKAVLGSFKLFTVGANERVFEESERGSATLSCLSSDAGLRAAPADADDFAHVWIPGAEQFKLFAQEDIVASLHVLLRSCIAKVVLAAECVYFDVMERRAAPHMSLCHPPLCHSKSLKVPPASFLIYRKR